MADSFIALNVGGKVYQTKRSTLVRYRGSIFQTLFEDNGPFMINQNEEGHFLIDRDGETFRYVLNFLRCGRLVLPDGFQEYELLKCEAEFFKLEELKKAIQEQTHGAIGLRVGGKTFRMTTEQALKEEGSFFARMLSGKTSTPRDSIGNFVVDRDASMFRLVLRYLRDGTLPALSYKELDLLKKEGQYFGLPSLSRRIADRQHLKQKLLPDACLNLHE